MQSRPNSTIPVADIVTGREDTSKKKHNGSVTTIATRRPEPPISIPRVLRICACPCPLPFRKGSIHGPSAFRIVTSGRNKPILHIRHLVDGQQIHLVRRIIPALCAMHWIGVVYYTCSFDYRPLTLRKCIVQEIIVSVVLPIFIRLCPVAIQPAAYPAGLPGDTCFCLIILLAVQVLSASRALMRSSANVLLLFFFMFVVLLQIFLLCKQLASKPSH